MKRLLAFIIILALAPLVSGCSVTSLSHQVIVMGVDKSEGGVKLTLQLPKHEKGGEGGGGGGGGGGGDSGGGSKGAQGYVLLSAEGKDPLDALSKLHMEQPYDISFAQLRELIICEEIARNEGVTEILHELAGVRMMNQNARVLIARGRAQEYIEKQKPEFGLRLSKHIDTTISELRLDMIVPDSALGLVLRGMDTGRMDPMLTLGQVKEDKSRALGAALISNGVMTGELSPEETRLATMFRLGYFHISASVTGGLKLTLDTGGADAEKARALAQKLQSLDCDALGFESAAAFNFSTEREFAEYDFKARYREAEIVAK